MVRVVVTGWLFQLKILSRSSFFLGSSAVQPLILATAGCLLFRAGHREGMLLWVAIGAGFMGIWASTLFGSGSAIGDQRHQGTLELLVASPAPLLVTVLPITLASASVGLYALLATLLWGWSLFGVPLTLAHPAWFAVSIPVAVLSLGALGLVIAGAFVLYRYSNALSNLMETPVWLLSGLLVPASMLPGWANPLAWLIAPTWGVQAVRLAALGGNPLPAIAACLGLAAGYLITGACVLRYVEHLACQRGTLALA